MNMAEQERPAGRQAGDQRQLVSFHLAGEEYGIDILSVQEINRMLSITKVPSAPQAVEGVINLRGRVIPVVSLRKKFGIPDCDHDARTRIIVVNMGGGRTAGLVVDSVSEVLRLDAASVQPPPSVVSARGGDYILGIGKIDERLLILLDLDRIFDDEFLDAVDGVLQ